MNSEKKLGCHAQQCAGSPVSPSRTNTLDAPAIPTTRKSKRQTNTNLLIAHGQPSALRIGVQQRSLLQRGGARALQSDALRVEFGGLLRGRGVQTRLLGSPGEGEAERTADWEGRNRVRW